MPFGVSRPEMRQEDCEMLEQGCFFLCSAFTYPLFSPGSDSTYSSWDALVWEKAWRKAPCRVLPAWGSRDQEYGAEGCSTGFPLSHPSQLDGWGGGSVFGEGAPKYSCPEDVGWWKG